MALMTAGALLCGCGNSVMTESVETDSSKASSADGWSGSTDLYAVSDEDCLEEYAGEEASSEESTASEYENKIIKTYSFGIETTDSESTNKLIRSKVSEYGGYIESSNMYDGGTEAYYVVRIPQDNADAFLNDSEEFGTKTYENESQEDITMSYYDTEAHIEALETQHERLLELMEEASSIDDIVALEERLSEVEYELSSYEQTLKIYDNQVNYVTINIDVYEVSTVSTIDDDTFGERIIKGLRTNLDTVAVFFVNLAVTLITGLPIFAVWALVIVIIVLIVRKIKKSRRAKKEKLMAETEKKDIAGEINED